MKILIVAATLATATTVAHAGIAPVLDNGAYMLGNHPDGNAADPLYGLRLDELYDATGGHDRFTFNFEHPLSGMTMTVTDDSVTIAGQAYGGRDTGSNYADDLYRGVYTIEFTYDLDVTIGEDTILAANVGTMRDTGTITTPLGDIINLASQMSGSRTFEVSADHRGFDGLSGFGWLNHGDDAGSHISASDWLFTIAAPLVPAPSAISLVGLGLAGLIRRKRR